MGTDPLIQRTQDSTKSSQRVPASPSPLAIKKRQAQMRAWIAIVVGLVLWQLVAQYVVHNASFLASPLQVGVQGWHMVLTGDLETNAAVSGEEFIIGYLAGCALGIVIGAGMATFGRLHDYLTPWVSALYASPIIALAPLLIIWFGIGVLSKVVVVIFLVVFPMIINTEAGLNGTDRRLKTAARAFGAKPLQEFVTVSMPSAAPFVVAGLRLAVGRGLIGVVVGELFGAKAGLGEQIVQASSVFDMPTLFVALVVLALAGIVLTNLLQKWENHLASWREVS